MSSVTLQRDLCLQLRGGFTSICVKATTADSHPTTADNCCTMCVHASPACHAGLSTLIRILWRSRQRAGRLLPRPTSHLTSAARCNGCTWHFPITLSATTLGLKEYNSGMLSEGKMTPRYADKQAGRGPIPLSAAHCTELVPTAIRERPRNFPPNTFLNLWHRLSYRQIYKEISSAGA